MVRHFKCNDAFFAQFLQILDTVLQCSVLKNIRKILTPLVSSWLCDYERQSFETSNFIKFLKCIEGQVAELKDLGTDFEEGKRIKFLCLRRKLEYYCGLISNPKTCLSPNQTKKIGLFVNWSSVIEYCL